MDILVTTPKSEIKNSRKEASDITENGGYYFRTFKKRPNLQYGDRIYFVEDGFITGYGTVFEIENLSDSKSCDSTGRLWGEKGDCIVKYDSWKFLKEKIPYKGFQGYRYINRIPGLYSQLKGMDLG